MKKPSGYCAGGNFVSKRKFNTPINSQIFNEAIERMIKELNLMQSNLEQIEKFGGHTFVNAP